MKDTAAPKLLCMTVSLRGNITTWHQFACFLTERYHCPFVLSFSPFSLPSLWSEWIGRWKRLEDVKQVHIVCVSYIRTRSAFFIHATLSPSHSSLPFWLFQLWAPTPLLYPTSFQSNLTLFTDKLVPCVFHQSQAHIVTTLTKQYIYHYVWILH